MRPILSEAHRSRGLMSIIRNGSWQSGMVIYHFCIRLGYMLAVSLLLGPEGYGFFAYAQTYYLAFLPLVLLGLDVILPREIGKHAHAAAPLIHRTFSLRLTLGIVFVCIAIGLGLWLEQDPQHQWLIALISLTLIPRAFQIWCGAVLLGFERSRIQAVLLCIFRTLEVAIGSIALLWCEAGLIFIIALHVILWTTYAIASCIYIHRKLLPLRFRLVASDFKELIGENVTLSVQMFLGSIMINALPLIYRHTAEDLATYGQFALAFQAIRIIADVLDAFNSAAAPILARSHQRQDRKDVHYAFGASFGFLALGVLALVTLHWVGEPLLLAVMGSQYALAGSLLALMAVWLPCHVAKSPLYLWLHTRKRAELLIKEHLICIITLGMGLVWFGWHTPQQLIMALSLAMGVSYASLLYQARRVAM